MDFANVNSSIPGFSTKIVPDLHGFTWYAVGSNSLETTYILFELP